MTSSESFESISLIVHPLIITGLILGIDVRIAANPRRFFPSVQVFRPIVNRYDLVTGSVVVPPQQNQYDKLRHFSDSQSNTIGEN